MRRARDAVNESAPLYGTAARHMHRLRAKASLNACNCLYTMLRCGLLAMSRQT